MRGDLGELVVDRSVFALLAHRLEEFLVDRGVVSSRIAAKTPGCASGSTSVWSSQAMPDRPFFADSSWRAVTLLSSASVTLGQLGTCIGNRYSFIAWAVICSQPWCHVPSLTMRSAIAGRLGRPSNAAPVRRTRAAPSAGNETGDVKRIVVVSGTAGRRRS